jgi:mRNA-degrading endonuclease RelE of RelBE toxin-antitoxin system
LAYSVSLSREAEATLVALSRSDRQRCRHLALLLLSLEKTPRPTRSRSLGKDAQDDERVWELAGFRVAYRVHDDKKRVDVGLVHLRE